MKIFLAGAVSFAKKEQLEKYNVYKSVLMNQIKDIVLVTPDDIWNYRKHCETHNFDLKKIQIDNLMVQYDLSEVKSCDLIVCDLSEISTGMGLELGVALENNKKILFLYKKNSYVSNMITGAFMNSCFIEYSDIKELEKKLKTEIKNIIN